MRVIDLTESLFDHMPVYPGDPDVVVRQIHTLKQEGWNLRLTTLTTHTGTHVNTPIHMTENGKTLDDLPMDRFFGPCTLYKPGMAIDPETGIIFTRTNIDMAMANILVKTPPKFIGLAKEYEFDIAVEKFLLEHDIVSYENLIQTDKLPDQFMFYGFPLPIKGGDGSPVRAIAIIG